MPPVEPSEPEHLRQFRQSLSNEVDNIEQEARMVLPGIQALFGFQLIAVFNQGFKVELSHGEQIVHLIALLLVTLAGVLVMAPAAYHRQANHQISKHFVQLSSRFLAWAMIPLALGCCLDIYVVTRIILQSRALSIGVASTILCAYTGIWFVFPKIRSRKLHGLPVHPLPENKS